MKFGYSLLPTDSFTFAELVMNSYRIISILTKHDHIKRLKETQHEFLTTTSVHYSQTTNSTQFKLQQQQLITTQYKAVALQFKSSKKLKKVPAGLTVLHCHRA
jgi:hypothetical protein